MKDLFAFLLSIPIILNAQNYTSYFTGNPDNVVTNPSGGICMMGGATENDNAMRWFLQQAKGGDILVLRASGTNGYNNYMYSQLGVSVNSVETIVFHNASASNEAYIHSKIQQAEAIWFAGGNQWTYISYWRNTPIANLINQAIQERNIVIGGTSAGMAILGGYYYSAQNGSVTSAQALSNPYHNLVTIDSAPFLQLDILQNVITDTHFDNPNRKGRSTTFLARILKEQSFPLKGIACDEYTAVCVGTDGIARVYGAFPQYDDIAYFIQPNCGLENVIPESCQQSTPLTWNLGGQSVKVYKVMGTQTGSNSFNLNNWISGNGGTWENWYVNNGTLVETSGQSIECACGSCTCLDSRFVTSTSDSGPGTLRSAVNCVPSGGRIIYRHPNLSTVLNHSLELNRSMEIKNFDGNTMAGIEISHSTFTSNPALIITGQNSEVRLENILIHDNSPTMHGPILEVQSGSTILMSGVVDIRE